MQTTTPTLMTLKAKTISAAILATLAGLADTNPTPPWDFRRFNDKAG
jgi:hypothetical protein